MLHLVEIRWHIALIKPNDIYRASPALQIVISKVWQFRCIRYLSQFLVNEESILVLRRNVCCKATEFANLDKQPLIVAVTELFESLWPMSRSPQVR